MSSAQLAKVTLQLVHSMVLALESDFLDRLGRDGSRFE